MSIYRHQNKRTLEELAEEIQIKEERIRNFLVEEQLDGIIIGKNYNFAWLTAGGNNKLTNNQETGAAEILITKGNKYILTNNLEEQRLREEEVFNQEFTFLKRKWHEHRTVDNLTSGLKLGSDLPTKGVRYVGQELAELRYSLTDSELAKYKDIGQKVGQIITAICRQLEPGVSEHEVAGLLAKELWSVGITPVSLLVAADERITKYGHPQPTDKRANNRVIISLAAQCEGLIVSLTRLVSFGSLPYQLVERFDDLFELEKLYLAGTEVEEEVAELFKKVVAKYKDLGYDDEWELSDHGGALGYTVRDYLVTAASDKKIKENQPLAWSPALPGLKLEDTVVATAEGPELITMDSEWPHRSYVIQGRKFIRPEVMVL